MRIDGKDIANDILAKVKAEIETGGQVPSVCVVTVEPTAATESYLRIKTARAEAAGMQLHVLRFEATDSEEKIITQMLSVDAAAIVVQLPLPPHFDTQKIVNAIPLEKDADVLSADAYDCFEKEVMGALLPPVVGALSAILERAHSSLLGKKVVVIGNGKLVGRPAQVWCEREGADVVVATRETENLKEVLLGAEVIISGAGVPNLIQPEMLQEGVVLIDAGTSESGGAIVGDANPLCEAKCSVFTPVPGGVGPIAVAQLFKNIATLVEKD